MKPIRLIKAAPPDGIFVASDFYAVGLLRINTTNTIQLNHERIVRASSQRM